MNELVADSLSIEIAGVQLLKSVSYRLVPGQLLALIGPNGAGKTTLLRTSLGLLRPDSGSSRLGNRSMLALSAAERARAIAYLPQLRQVAWPSTVRQVVSLGRFAYGASPGHLGVRDAEAVERALNATELYNLAERSLTTLSGGELARVHCARALASEAPLLLADEPVAALDPRHQFSVLELLRRFCDEGGGALVVLHDLPLAVRYADELLWLTEGSLVAQGPASTTLTEERIAEVFGVSARLEHGQLRLLGPL